MSDSPPFHAPGPAPPRGVQAREVGVFVLLLLPALLLGQFVSTTMQPGFVLFAIGAILRDAALVGLVLYFLWRNREPVARIGWVPRGVPRELVVGLALVFPFALVQAVITLALRAAGLTGHPQAPSLLPEGSGEIALAVILVGVVAIAEETIFRGYLLLRLHAVARSKAAAVVLSSVLFALGHGYQGPAGIVAVGIIGVILALVYVWRGSLVAPIVLHFVQNFSGLVLAPLFGQAP